MISTQLPVCFQEHYRKRSQKIMSMKAYLRERITQHRISMIYPFCLDSLLSSAWSHTQFGDTFERLLNHPNEDRTIGENPRQKMLDQAL